MGFRNPFRIQVDENDVAYVTDYSPDSQTPDGLPRTRRHRSGRDRAQAVQLRLAGLLRRPTCRTTSGTSTPVRRSIRRPSRSSATTPLRGRRTRRAGTPAWSTGRRSRSRTSGTRTKTTRSRRAARRASRTTTGSGTTQCPQLFPELLTGGVGPHGAAKYHYDPDNPNPTKFPPYYDEAVFFGEFTRDYLREIRLDSQNAGVQDQQPARLRRRGEHGLPVRVRQPDGHAVRCGRGVLPADVRRRLLRRERGRRHVQVGVRQGHAGAARGAQREPHRRPCAAHGAVRQRPGTP